MYPPVVYMINNNNNLGQERAYFILHFQVTVHHEGKSGY